MKNLLPDVRMIGAFETAFHTTFQWTENVCIPYGGMKKYE